jgi:serine/threonine protein kinase
MTSFDTLMNTRTLAQRLAEGRIPVPDALRYAMQIAEALRKLHEEGRVHGWVSPVSIALNNNSVELMASMAAAGAATPYSAPEVMAGRAPDTRSDIFSFGTVVYEMLTGKRAFEGADRSKPAPSGSPAVDRFVAGCVAIDPAARLQNIKRVMMELKLLNAAARRAETPSAGRSGVSDSGLRTEMQELETRLGARVNEQQKFVAEMQHAVTEAIATLRGQLAAVGKELAASRGQSEKAEQGLDAAAGERIVSQVQQSVDAVGERMASVQLSVDAAAVRIAALEQGVMQANTRVEELEHKEVPSQAPAIPAGVQQTINSAGERIARLEQALEAANHRVAELETRPAAVPQNPQLQQNLTALTDRVSHIEQGFDGFLKRSSELQDLVTKELQNFEKTLQSQSASIESARTAMAQTDDLVERVVEALESLQTIVLEQSGDRAAIS